MTLRSALSRHLRSFLAHNGHGIGSRLPSGSRAMLGSLRRAGLSLHSSGYQRPSLRFSGSRRPNQPSRFSQERSIAAERQAFLRRADVFLASPGLGCSHLLRVLRSLLLQLPPLRHPGFRPGTLSNSFRAISSSTTHCALRGFFMVRLTSLHQMTRKSPGYYAQRPSPPFWLLVAH